MLGLKNPAFLLGLILVLVPLLIHLIGRKRIEQVYFGAFRFLRKHAQRVVRQHRLLEALLVACRCLIMAGLALAFAWPFLRAQSDAASGLDDADTAVLILLDNSYSMGVGSRLQDAKARAAALLDNPGSGASLSLATLAGGVQVVAGPTRDTAQLRKALDQIQPTPLAASLNRALEQAGRILENAKVNQRRLVLISDMANSAWERKEPLRLPPRTKLQLEAVATQASTDVCVRQIVVPAVVLAGGFEQELIAEVANESATRKDGVAVHLTLAGKEVEKRSINLRPHSTALVRFRQRFETSGDFVGSVKVDSPDERPDNNERPFVISVLPRVQVLVINGDPDPSAIKNDAFFLGRALSPDPSSPIAVKEARASNWDPATLAGVDVVMLANVSKLPDTSVAALEKFIKSGGGLAAFVGAKVLPEETNASLARILPCKLREMEEARPEQPLTISTVDYTHEVFQAFDGPHNGNLATARFTRYFGIKDSQSAQVLARFNPVSTGLPQGAPAVLVRNLGKGRTLLFVSSVDLEWNDFCLKTVFLPFVQEATRWLCRQRLQASPNRQVGQTIRCPLQNLSADVVLTTPSGQTEKPVVQTAGTGDSGQSAACEFTPAQPGLYTVTCGNEKFSFAANIAPEELQTATFDPRELSSALAYLDDAAAASPQQLATDDASPRQPLWTAVLILVALLLGTEMVLANYLTRN